ncbi:MAG: hypoxanthine phosphoribosyltransferase [Tenuifilum sp.]|uniref:hypoxanthine phosphoribosyltransferase n=2 Tax=Tenuifilaceae TaxID=2760872 RepID=UPI002BF61026|nr:hypoxanthine phosphoribosyltransferase [Tenuifilum sp.]HOK85976.1 hypoxanthine phosphoribosyltransferase [Tenuifilum sp.]HON70765.1 hypoxanthine phosphoribosyltransferase [Tenuifilum sp.]HPP90256.1 hypoxanthine phosphoribosyltransferase [Tenuifilum sp.]HRU86601.1 hypoxanthine phosphoribosyltransferase [Tenuifilum sp.]
MKQVKLKDKEFRLSYPEAEIQNDIDLVASKINHDFAKSGEVPFFVSVLNGSFMFTADLLKRITVPCEVSFVKLASYQGTSSTGKVNELIGLNENVTGRTLVVLEDIVDTGITLSKLYEELRKLNPKEIRVATLLFKPEAYKGNIKLDYIGRSIPNDFIVGYGLDYDGLGRNLPDIYTLI